MKHVNWRKKDEDRIKSNHLTEKRIGQYSFAKGYKKVRVVIPKKKQRSYTQIMVCKGKISSQAIFVVGKGD